MWRCEENPWVRLMREEAARERLFPHAGVLGEEAMFVVESILGLRDMVFFLCFFKKNDNNDNCK